MTEVLLLPLIVKTLKSESALLTRSSAKRGVSGEPDDRSQPQSCKDLQRIREPDDQLIQLVDRDNSKVQAVPIALSCNKTALC